ncbi:MAG: BACON domain-containing carbohydrate-binding protein [Rikenellaceae bacterium]|nr:BACON domain-containing carbohydrate-binding protein [Rikenellaceae bacterium]
MYTLYMNSTTKRLTLLTIAILSLLCCKPDPRLSVSISTLTVPDVQSETMFLIASNTEWSISGTTDWCTVTQSSGDGSENVGITVSANTTKLERSTTLTIIAGPLSSTIVVTQKQDDALILTKSTENLDYTAHTIAVTLKSNIVYDVIIPSDVDWITEIKSKSFDTYTHNFLIAANKDYDPRTAIIIFKDKNGFLSDTLTINQAKLNGIIISNPDVSLGNDGGSITVELRANVDYEIAIPLATAEWISLLTTKGLQTYNHTLTVEKNDSFDERTGYVIFKDKQTALADTLVVHQGATSSLILSEKTSNIGSDGGVVSVELMSNVSYDIIMEQETNWVTKVDSKSLTLYKHDFAVSANSTYDQRSMRIIFKDKNSSLSDTLVINQAQKNGLILTDNKISIEAAGGIIDVELKSNVSYDIILPAGIGWFTQLNTKGLTTYNYQFNVAANTTYDQRSTMVIFKDKNSTLADTLTVNQAQMRTLVLSNKSQTMTDTGGTFSVQLSSSVSYETTIAEGALWITDITTKSVNSYTHEFSVSQNNTLEERIGKIIFKDKGSSLADTVTVTQSKAGVLLFSEDKFYVPRVGGTCNFTLFTNVEYNVTIKNGTGWITQLTTKSFNSKQYSFVITSNTTTSDRFGQIIFSAQNGSGADTIDVKQSAYEGGFIHINQSQTAGSLIPETDRSTLRKLKIEGFVKAADFTFFRDSLPVLEELDLGEATIEDDAIPAGAFKTISPAVRSLKVFVMPSTVKSIGAEAFYDCTNLERASLPTALTSIGNYAFSGCSKITTVSIPATVTSIGGYAFSNCPLLAYVKSMITEPFEINNVFLGINANADLEVPEGKLSLYESTTGWGYTFFKRIYETGADPEASVVLSTTSLKAIGKASSGSVSVTSSSPWTVYSRPDWISTSVTGASGNATVNLEFAANTAEGASVRIGKIIFKVTGSGNKDTLEVTQYTNKYADKDFDTRQTHTLGGGINVVFVGDGFILDEIVSGEYDQVIDQAVTHFFDIEPYTTYKNYFNVHVVYAYSQESGCSNLLTTKNTAMSVKYTGAGSSTSMSADNDACFDYGEAVPGVDLKKTLIVVVPNSTRYGGTCWMWSTGESIALCPISGNAFPYDFRGVIQHEACGHGFGGLADEYVNYDTATITDEEKLSAQNWQANGFFGNIDFTNDLATIRWKHFIGVTGYSYVGAYEGAYYYGHGVWRPESSSCMITNIRYFNAPSREQIVKRIMTRSGGTYSFSDFQSKDVMQYTPPTKGGLIPFDKSKALARPVLVKGSPKRK